MAVSYNTGAAAVTESGAGSFTLTVPAGVLPGDLLLVAATSGFTQPFVSDLTVVSSGTALTQLGPIQRQDAFFSFEYGLYCAVATGADPGAVITASFPGAARYGIAVVSYTGCSASSPVDASGSTGNNAATITDPPLTTIVDQDWAVEAGVTYASSVLVQPAGTPRVSASTGTTGGGVAIAVIDSGTGVAAGSPIGGQVWAPTEAGAYVNFASTAGISPSAGTPPPLAATAAAFTRGISMWR